MHKSDLKSGLATACGFKSRLAPCRNELSLVPIFYLENQLSAPLFLPLPQKASFGCNAVATALFATNFCGFESISKLFADIFLLSL